MGVIQRVQHFFSSGRLFTPTNTSGPAAATGVTSNLANFLIELSKFQDMDEDAIYEQLYIWEPEVASTINKMADMVRSSYKYFMLIDDSELEDLPDLSILDLDDTTQPPAKPTDDAKLKKKMVATANQIARKIDVPNLYETYAIVLNTYGMIILEKNKDLSFSIIPNKKVTFLDDRERIQGGGISALDPNHIMTAINYVVIDEGLMTQRILKKGEFIVIKFNDAPINIIDKKSRKTFGMYAISPLQRAVIPVWMKRQLYIVETLWRWANVPREHHKIDAAAFNLNLYPGTPEQKRTAAERDLNSFISSYAAQISNKPPDKMYITSSNVSIENIEHSAAGYMQSNDLLGQLDESLWNSLNLPRSVVRGTSESSYASELIISSYTSLKVQEIARKVSRVVLENMKERLLLVNPDFPVEYLDIKNEFELASSRLEAFKNMQLMSTLGLFTPTEIREEGGFAAITDDQKKEGVVNTSGKGTVLKIDNDMQVELPEIKETTPQVSTSTQGVKTEPKPDHPTTPHSANTQPSDSADSVLKKGQYEST